VQRTSRDSPRQLRITPGVCLCQEIARVVRLKALELLLMILQLCRPPMESVMDEELRSMVAEFSRPHTEF
jgi:hypothetical protein